MEGQHDQPGQPVVTHHHAGSGSPPSVPPASIPAQSIERLTRAIDLLNRRSSLWHSFWHGLLIGIGSTVGVVLVFYGIAWIFSQLDFIPGLERFGDILRNISQQRTGGGE